LEVFPSISACACSAFVLYHYLLSLFAQIFHSPFVYSRLWRKKSKPLALRLVGISRSKIYFFQYVQFEIASFMPIKLYRAIQPLWASRAITHKDVAFTF
jgi:hypothetical protein